MTSDRNSAEAGDAWCGMTLGVARETSETHGNGEVGPTAADDWACTSHSRTAQIHVCARLGIEDGATAAVDPLCPLSLHVEPNIDVRARRDVEDVAGKREVLRLAGVAGCGERGLCMCEGEGKR